MSAPTVVGLSIPADESQPVAVVSLTPDLPGIRQHVGEQGAQPFVEVVGLGEAVAMWLDEDGRANPHLGHNARASRLIVGRVLGGEDVRGDVLVLGFTDDGQEASLTVDAVAWLSRALGVEVTA